MTRELRAELARQDLSQERFAKILGWEPSKLNRRLKGKVPWSVEDVEMIASVLDIPRSQLLDPPMQHRRAAAAS